MDPTQTSAYHGWKRFLPWPTTTKGMQEKNCSTTVVEAFRRHCIPCPLKPQRMKFMIYFCKTTAISKLHLSTYLPFNRSNKILKNLQEAFKRAVDLEPRILTKQCIHTRKVNEANHIDISSDYQEFKVNEVQHVQNPNYKGKNYIQIIRRTKITTIAIPTALTTTRTAPTMATTPPTETSETTTRVTTQSYHQT